MPTSRGEWSLFVVSCVVIASLIALILVAWQNYSGLDPAERPGPSGAFETSGVSGAHTARTSTARDDSTEPQSTKREHTDDEKQIQAAPLRSRRVNLRLKAAMGDCWLEVRARSATGSVLYRGLLAEGQTLRFRRRALWIRARAPLHLAMRLNGQPVKDFPLKTADALINAHGVEILRLG